jgi:hypothetical protein
MDPGGNVGRVRAWLLVVTGIALQATPASAEPYRRRATRPSLAPPPLTALQPVEAPRSLPSRGAGEPLTFRALTESLENASPASFSDLVGALPPSLFEDYVLMRESQSLQDASAEKPRAILFGGGGDVIVAVGAHGSSLEAIEYNRRERRWDFYEIHVRDGKLAVSEPNPSRCTRCHGEPLRPNWEPYLLWPGAYGERDGVLGRDAEDFDRFVAKAAQSPLYRRLPELAEHYTLQDESFDPNTRFTLTVTKRNLERVAAELAGSPAFPSLKYAMAAAVAGCGKVSGDRPSLDFLPAGTVLRSRAEELLAAKLKAGRATHRDAALPVDLYVLEALLEAAGVGFDVANASTVHRWKEFFERSAAQGSSLDPFSHGFGGIEQFVDWGLAAVDREIDGLVAPVRAPYLAGPSPATTRSQQLTRPFLLVPTVFFAGAQALCPMLEVRSLAALAGFTPPIPRTVPKPGTAPTHRR